ncbi:MAG: alpha/beta fold hydrolase [Acidimicrobiales bacterium]
MTPTEPMTDVSVPGFGLTLAGSAYGDPTGPPILLSHGGGQTRHAWRQAGQRLADSGRYALSIDLRGHGDSDWAADAAYDLDDFAADVHTVAVALGRPALVGASLGGLASLTAIGESEEPIASALVLVDVTPRLHWEGAMRIRDFMTSGLGGFERLEDAADAIAEFNPHRPRSTDLSGLSKNLRLRDGRWHWHWDPAFMTARSGVDGQSGLVRHDRLAAAARRVEVPTLLVRGQMSDIVSEEGVAELRQLIPHAEVADVAGAGHMVAGDKNDAFNEAVIEFLGRTATC